MLELMTTANVIGGYASCRLANNMQKTEGQVSRGGSAVRYEGVNC